MLVQCPDCHTSYSNMATSCPKCGYQVFNVVQNINSFFRFVKWMIVTLALCGIAWIFIVILAVRDAPNYAKQIDSERREKEKQMYSQSIQDNR